MSQEVLAGVLGLSVPGISNIPRLGVLILGALALGVKFFKILQL